MRSSPIPVARAGLFGVCACATMVFLAGCDSQRKEDCAKFLPAMSGMATGMPSVETVDQVLTSVGGIQFADEPLKEYATNYKNTLTVLSNTLKLKSRRAWNPTDRRTARRERHQSGTISRKGAQDRSRRHLAVLLAVVACLAAVPPNRMGACFRRSSRSACCMATEIALRRSVNVSRVPVIA